jgi:tubulin-folding cofactor B
MLTSTRATLSLSAWFVLCRYVGKVSGLADGWWVGVAFDEPLGKGDGSAKGKRYYECTPGHGSFVRPDKVTAGDFPPLDDFSDLGSDEI